MYLSKKGFIFSELFSHFIKKITEYLIFNTKYKQDMTANIIFTL